MKSISLIRFLPTHPITTPPKASDMKLPAKATTISTLSYALLLVALSAWSPPAYAQQPEETQYPRINRKALAPCERDRARFCPDLSTTSSAQNESICLKYFKSNLSLSCRKALNGGK